MLVHVHAAGQCEKEDDPGFDFFILNRQWGPNYCTTTKCPKTAYEAFTLHGLWPQYNNGGWPQYCDCYDVFSTNNLAKSTRSSMACNWVSYKGSDSSFWDHQWEKHGTCSTDVLPSQEKYFNKTLELDEKYDIGTALSNAEIDPQTDNSVKKSDIVEALTAAFGVAPTLKCRKNRNILVEIWLCFNKDYTVRSCPGKTASSTCGDWLYFESGDEIPDSCLQYLP